MKKPDVHESMTQIAQRAVKIDKDTPPEKVDFLLQSFSSLDNALREAIQAATAPQVEALISRLQKEDALTAGDIDLMRLWIVGDAQAYIDEENNFEEWVQEANRLVKLVATAEKGSMDVEAMNKLQGAAQDGIKTLSDIENYLNFSQRAHNFEESVKHLTKQNKETLANVLQAKLKASDM
jgi:hypothetical protein